MPAAATAGGSDLAVTRWREDITSDDWGSFCYVRDRRERRRLVDDVSADRPRGRRLRGRSSRRTAPCSAASTARSRRARRSSSRPKTTSSCGACRSPITDCGHAARADQLRRGRAGPGRRRPGASGVQQSVRRDASVPERDALLCTRRPRSGERPRLPRARAERRGDRVGGQHSIRNRSRAVRRPRPDAGAAGRAASRAHAVEHDRRRCSIRSSACAQSHPAAARRDRARRVHTAYAETRG